MPQCLRLDNGALICLLEGSRHVTPLYIGTADQAQFVRRTLVASGLLDDAVLVAIFHAIKRNELKKKFSYKFS